MKSGSKCVMGEMMRNLKLKVKRLIFNQTALTLIFVCL